MCQYPHSFGECSQVSKKKEQLADTLLPSEPDEGSDDGRDAALFASGEEASSAEVDGDDPSPRPLAGESTSETVGLYSVGFILKQPAKQSGS
jgi:hypothetical protein